jgi:predicted metalloenzyme YecM
MNMMGKNTIFVVMVAGKFLSKNLVNGRKNN